VLYLWVKSFHIVFVVSWMAGLFYLVRLFVYHADANREGGTRLEVLGPQFALMESRLYRIITTPAMVLTWVTGLSMVLLNPAFIREPWFVAKAVLVLLLSAYHGGCAGVMRGLAAGVTSRTGEFYRVANEGPTLILVLVVLLVVFKGLISFGTLGWVLAATVGVIWLGFKAYATYRRSAAGASSRHAGG
jgi:putative membrane protein